LDSTTKMPDGVIAVFARAPASLLVPSAFGILPSNCAFGADLRYRGPLTP
jgi:hypothetical protein